MPRKKKDDVAAEPSVSEITTKPFPDPNNNFRWYIEYEQIDAHSGAKTGERVVAWFRHEVDYERGLERYESTMKRTGTV